MHKPLELAWLSPVSSMQGISATPSERISLQSLKASSKHNKEYHSI
jgi:hypothetical protein